VEHKRVERKKVVVIQRAATVSRRCFIVYGLHKRPSVALEVGEMEGELKESVRNSDGTLASYDLPFIIVSEWDGKLYFSDEGDKTIGALKTGDEGHLTTNGLARAIHEIVHADRSIMDYFARYYADAPADSGHESYRKRLWDQQSISETSTR
jgi:hypothetical protein